MARSGLKAHPSSREPERQVLDAKTFAKKQRAHKRGLAKAAQDMRADETEAQRDARWEKHGPDHDDPADMDAYNKLVEETFDDSPGGRAKRAAGRLEDRGAARGAAPTVGQDGAGVILGAFATVLLLQYLNGGMAGVRAWLAAKFLNRTGGGSGGNALGSGKGNDLGLLSIPGLAGAKPVPGTTTKGTGPATGTANASSWQQTMGLTQTGQRAPVTGGSR